MPELEFSLSRIFLYSVLIRKNTGQKKPVVWHILHSLILSKYLNTAQDTEGYEIFSGQFSPAFSSYFR